MPFIYQIQRQSDYNLFSSAIPIFIDNGASYFRIGWAGQTDPRVIFRNIVQRPRHNAAEQIYHPVLITECVCNPVQSRSKMAELLYKTYGVPSVGIDSCGLAICPGFKTTHDISICFHNLGIYLESAFPKSEPVYKGCCRTNIGGYRVTGYLKQLLSLKYPHHTEARFTREQVEDMKMEYCYIAPGTKEAEDKTRCWQLPWVSPPVEEPPSEEEIARKAAIKERQAAFDRGKGEDTFGTKDEDWQLYKLMSKDNDDDDEGPDEDEVELARISSRLQEIDPTFVSKPDVGPSQPAPEMPQFRPLAKEDFQILLGVERFRCPEILFHPNLVGIDQAGLDEMAGAGIRMIHPCGSPIKVVRALDPVLDAWRGASTYMLLHCNSRSRRLGWIILRRVKIGFADTNFATIIYNCIFTLHNSVLFYMRWQ
ncbi:hypothetical protein P3X46_014261 [Hevea brasiliensis]|uniref:Actin-related protein 5 n=1 Tax=Hevea brasiliensis TaxID=3981 RepID=A0ABQ9M6B2_HEVBR|nr:hypothetical protein P3X46_014261 [Hevea brasiliensis]